MEEKKRKELFSKRKYFREHPEEAKKEYVKKFDGIGMVPIEPKKQDK